jgi:hypothetical protein
MTDGELLAWLAENGTEISPEELEQTWPRVLTGVPSAVTSFTPVLPQSFEALKAAAPPGLELLAVQWYGARLWLGIQGRPGTVLLVQAMAGPGVELIRYHDDEPNAVLQALADFWGCPIVCRHNDLERFDPTPR